MRKLALVAVILASTLTQPAAAAVLGSSNVSLGTTATPFVFSDASFLFSYDPAAAASFSDPYSIQTTGTGQASAFGGFLGIPVQPSPFDQSGVTIDGNLFPSFASFPDKTTIPYSVVAEDLPLRYMVGADYFYGYARLNGNGTLNLAFESLPNTAITAGATITGPLANAVPEPATWMMMLLGFGAVGFAARRRRSMGEALTA